MNVHPLNRIQMVQLVLLKWIVDSKESKISVNSSSVARTALCGLLDMAIAGNSGIMPFRASRASHRFQQYASISVLLLGIQVCLKSREQLTGVEALKTLICLLLIKINF
jgi:hypothetical protein